MYKELIISITIIISLFLLDKVTEKYLIESVEELTKGLNQVNEKIEIGEKEQQIKEIEEITENWNIRYEKLAYYIEHDELEKVKTKLVNIKSNIESEEEGDAKQNTDEAIYLLEHIKDKNNLDLKDIF